MIARGGTPVPKRQVRTHTPCVRALNRKRVHKDTHRAAGILDIQKKSTPHVAPQTCEQQHTPVYGRTHQHRT